MNGRREDQVFGIQDADARGFNDGHEVALIGATSGFARELGVAPDDVANILGTNLEEKIRSLRNIKVSATGQIQEAVRLKRLYEQGSSQAVATEFVSGQVPDNDHLPVGFMLNPSWDYRFVVGDEIVVVEEELFMPSRYVESLSHVQLNSNWVAKKYDQLGLGQNPDRFEGIASGIAELITQKEIDNG